MKRFGMVLSSVFALFLLFTMAPQAAKAAAVTPGAAVQIEKQAPALGEQTQWRRHGYYGHRHYYGGPRYYGRRYYRPRVYYRPAYRPRVVCRVQYTYYGPRRVCVRRW
ncbi:hypothetical protein GCM10007036_09890 [Alsobacter metallidurans]|uniref:Uncharacterized protein n=1 Tax=Alsobacter metallidurans TaxID=340221 RepID=A0A917I5S4_9HYPH|nr:hypothetical protein [Alsobacter metallidurans]GGH12225.1 hypothetical protein GCM10007036_09890 [Alsobacter metallidurans]